MSKRRVGSSVLLLLALSLPATAQAGWVAEAKLLAPDAALLVVDAEAESVDVEESFGEVILARGVPGARAFVDGHAYPVGPDGLAVIEAEAPIENLRVEAPGWVMLALQGFRSHERTPQGLCFALMVRE